MKIMGSRSDLPDRCPILGHIGRCGSAEAGPSGRAARLLPIGRRENDSKRNSSSSSKRILSDKTATEEHFESINRKFNALRVLEFRKMWIYCYATIACPVASMLAWAHCGRSRQGRPFPLRQ